MEVPASTSGPGEGSLKAGVSEQKLKGQSVCNFGEGRGRVGEDESC